MNLNLQGKTVLVTGSTAGIGYAIARMLHEEGASVIINGRTKERVESAVRTIGDIRGVVADLSTQAGTAKVIQEIPTVDILINNFGIFEGKNIQDLSEKDFSKMFHLNVLTGATLSLHYLKTMKEKNTGRIIFIASETGVNIPPDMIHYGVSKAAQIALSRGLAETTAGTGVTVNAVLPGPTLSEGVTRFLGDRSQVEFIQKLRPTSLIKRFANADEVAALVTYLASSVSSATNGAALRVEGGLLRNAL